MNQQQREVVGTLKEYVPNLLKGVLGLIEKINKNQLNETISTASDIVEGLQWVVEALKLTMGEAVLDEERFNELIREILMSYKSGDNILSKDLFKYEVLPLLESIEEALRQY